MIVASWRDAQAPAGSLERLCLRVAFVEHEIDDLEDRGEPLCERAVRTSSFVCSLILLASCF
jgi:hypothetical protein